LEELKAFKSSNTKKNEQRHSAEDQDDSLSSFPKQYANNFSSSIVESKRKFENEDQDKGLDQDKVMDQSNQGSEGSYVLENLKRQANDVHPFR